MIFFSSCSLKMQYLFQTKLQHFCSWGNYFPFHFQKSLFQNPLPHPLCSLQKTHHHVIVSQGQHFGQRRLRCVSAALSHTDLFFKEVVNRHLSWLCWLVTPSSSLCLPSDYELLRGAKPQLPVLKEKSPLASPSPSPLLPFAAPRGDRSRKRLMFIWNRLRGEAWTRQAQLSIRSGHLSLSDGGEEALDRSCSAAD